ncbi:7997_t:CDS:2 [Diversispora eburnea]|uniref:7997_t:CDS:1 n=1 Tax=Diversispora eburnea TaxID=1213867 RepID=A0A9N8VNC3_9GLOM|nr:7997_t:CDS:2 [Diversispora eburnea]
MSEKHHTSFFDEIDEFSSGKSITSSIEKDSLFFGSCIAISPDSKQIVTFSQETHEFKLYKVDDLSSNEIIYPPECGDKDKNLCWSIAISNCVDDDGNERLIALSCFDARKFRHGEMHDDEKNGLDFGDKVDNQYVDNKNYLDFDDNDKNDLEYGDDESDLEYSDDESDLKYGDDLKYDDNCLRPQTWVISTKDGSEIYTSLESIGGVIRFLDRDDNDDHTDESDSDDSDDSHQPLLKSKSKKRALVIIIVNASGIFKESIKKRKLRFFSRSSKREQFELPKQLSIRLSRDHWQSSFELLHISIIKNHFVVYSFKNRQQIIEMYSLITGDLEMLFKRYESSVASNIIYGSPIFAISQNEKILAFCRGTPSLTLYFMENGLEITTKQFEGQRGIYKIIALNFIDNDSKLLIVFEEKKKRQRENSKHQIFVVWDLFTTFENSIRQIDYSETKKPLKMDFSHRLMYSHGTMFAVRGDGDIFSVLDHNEDVASIRYPSVKAKTKIDIPTRDHVYHAIYNINGERFDASELEENRIIMNNVEPWHSNDCYFRTSVYLDFAESTQLIISSNTIQVWKYRNNAEKRDRVLEYIWARKKAIDVQELRIGEQEFVLKVLVSSTPLKSMTIHWPNNANVLEGACRALYVLAEKNHVVAGHENVNQIKYLIECTQRLVRKYITKYGIFRLTSIRYPIMKYLIKSHQENLIKHILHKKINRKHSNICIPRLYKWADEDNNKSTTEISMSDLHHAILCIQKRGDPTVILKYLIDYYADNAKEYNNHGWMCEFIQYLFKKPCFGITEAYTPPLHISPYDQKKGNNAAVIHSLVVKPCLALKFHNTLWFFLKNIFKSMKGYNRIEASHNDRKVYIAPLPDFTVYPNPKDLEDHNENYFWFLFTLFRISLWPRKKVINNTNEMSPFLRVIHEEKGYEIYQTPTIMAVLDFKWSAAHSNIVLAICLFVYLYTGWYLIVTEIVQLKREGWYRYINFYNIFDLGSVLFPLADNIASILYYRQVLIIQYSILNPVLAFTALVMWLQLILLMRYFEGPGRFIYIIQSILRTIWPFFAFMLIVILAFGHAMFILLNYADDLQIPTYKINDTSNSDLYSNITIYQDIDKSSRLDNYYSNFFSSVEAVFFWTNGRWDQLDQWDSYAVDVMSILGSIILVGTFDKANKEGHTVAHRYRAELIAEYEALEKPFRNKIDNSSYSKKYQHIQNEGSSSTIKPRITKCFDKFDRITFIDEEIFDSTKKSQRNKKSNNKLSKNNKSSIKDYTDSTINVDDQLSIQERFDSMEKRFDELEQNLKTILKTQEKFNNIETRFDKLEQNLESILKSFK